MKGKKIFPGFEWETCKSFISQNTFDLGLSRISPAKASIEEAAQWAIEYYDLILLNERFDESLILLKEIWQLELEDIISLKAKDNTAAKTFSVEDLPGNLTVRCTLRENNILVTVTRIFLHDRSYVEFAYI